jgi:hypothetical protein
VVDFTVRNAVVSIVVLILLIILFNRGDESSADNLTDWYRKMEFEGVVIGKFNDTDNHFNRTLVLRSYQGLEQEVIDNFDSSGLYNYLMLNDSVSKVKNQLDFLVSRNGSDTVFTFTLNPEN